MSDRLGFICADRWMRNAYGSHLRELITTHYAVESVWQMHSCASTPTPTAPSRRTRDRSLVVEQHHQRRPPIHLIVGSI